MTLGILNLIIISIPTMIGIVAGLAAASRSDLCRPGLAAMFAGIGINLSHLSLAGTVWMLNQLGFQVFTPLNFFLLSAIGVVSATACVYVIRLETLKSGLHGLSEQRTATLFIKVPMAVLVFIGCYQHFWLPVFGWDSLQHWMEASASFIENDTTEAGAPFIFYHRHPITVPLIGAFSGKIAGTTDYQLGPLWPWLTAWVSILLIIYGFIRAISKSMSLAVLLCYAYATVPLLENHALIPGYAELWLASIMVSAAVMIALGLQQNRFFYILVGVVLSTGLVWIKNSGPAFSFTLLCALALVYAVYYSRAWSLVLASIVCAVAGWLTTVGFDVNLAGNKFAFVPAHDSSVLIFGGKVMVVAPKSLLAVSWNEFHALFVNQSFSLWAVIMAMAASITVARVRHGGFESRHDSMAHCFLALTSVLSLVLLLTIQLFFDRGFIYATPDRDTGNSRFTLPLIVLGIVYCGHTFSTALNRINAFAHKSS